jgi:DNA-binding transcriptional ArsR family regulator
MAKSASKAAAEERQTTVDVNVLKALGHPLRQRILQALSDREASPSQVAKEIDEPLSNVSYHFKILVKCEAVALVRTEPVRGALEHFYRATMLPALSAPEWESLPQGMRNRIFDQTLKQAWDHIAEAGAKGFEDPRASVVWVPLDLDDEAFRQFGDEIERLTEIGLALQEQSRARSAENELEKTELALMHFHRA